MSRSEDAGAGCLLPIESLPDKDEVGLGCCETDSSPRARSQPAINAEALPSSVVMASVCLPAGCDLLCWTKASQMQALWVRKFRSTKLLAQLATHNDLTNYKMRWMHGSTTAILSNSLCDRRDAYLLHLRIRAFEFAKSWGAAC